MNSYIQATGNMTVPDKSATPDVAIEASLPAAQRPAAVGRRMKLARRFLKRTQGEFTAPIGLRSQSSWSNYEQGKTMLPAQVALALCNVPDYQRELGLSMDWIYQDDMQLLRTKFSAWLKQRT